MEGYFFGILFGIALIVLLLVSLSRNSKYKKPPQTASSGNYTSDRAYTKGEEFYAGFDPAADNQEPYYFIFDLETNGFPRDFEASPKNTENWPHPLSLAYYIFNARGELIKKKYFILDQDCKIDENSIEVNGLTEEIIKSEGINPKILYSDLLEDLSPCKVIVAHNLSFCFRVLKSDFFRKKLPLGPLKQRQICTMKRSASFVGIKMDYDNDFKWPKLRQLIAACFFINEDPEFFTIEENHNADFDARAVAKCFFYLKKINEI